MGAGCFMPLSPGSGFTRTKNDPDGFTLVSIINQYAVCESKSKDYKMVIAVFESIEDAKMYLKIKRGY